MWTNGTDLNRFQVEQCLAMGYSPEQVSELSWYVTANNTVSKRHRPRTGLSDQDVNLILTALRYLALSPHLAMVASGATRDDVARTMDRVTNELYGYGDESGQGGVDD